MAHRLVRARPRTELLAELRERLDDEEIAEMDPFGESMTRGLDDARRDPDTGEAVWIEEDYCSPPLAMEREAVLDDYFEDLRVVEDDVDPGAGWGRIADLPSLWDRLEG
jgi:hypothetical protein